MKSKIVAGLLALFLGGLGIHKFYLGRGGAGILYLLFFWTFIPAVIAFFDAIFLFLMDDEVFNAKYNRL
jgi:TM2 domain-containing membrane protein YozV